MVRCFVAVACPREVAANLAGVQALVRAMGEVKTVEEGGMHLTLKFLGEQDEAAVAGLKTALSSVRRPPFRMEVRGLGAFPDSSRPNVIWAGVGAGAREAAELSALVDTALKPLGHPPERRFHPHITLARAKGGINSRALCRAIVESRQTVYGSYDAAEFALLESRLSPDGPKYSPLASYPLRPA